jgi:vitamin B12 transporter
MLCKAIILAGLWSTNPVSPENDKPVDTLSIEGIVVDSKLQRFSSSLMLKVIPGLELKNSKQLALSDVLGTISNINVNSYGQGGSSSASLRGLGSYHTAILWNGINLQNPMNGGINTSIIPVNFIDQVAIQYGGNGALFGSGAIGGTIHLDNRLELGKGHSAELYQTYGSFNSYFTGANYTFSGMKFASSTRIFYSETENDYRFHNITKIGKPFENQVNANSSKQGLMQNFVAMLSDQSRLSSSIWIQKSFNRYPPKMTDYTNHETDLNSFFRSLIKYSYTGSIFDLNAKASYFYDVERYRNPGISDSSNHYSSSIIFESEVIGKIAGEHRIEAGVNINGERVKSTNYTDPKERIRPSATITYRYSKLNGVTDFYAGVRDEMVSDKANPITWSIGGRLRLANRFFIRMNLSSSYRVPVLNDLYWSGIMSKGNPNLLPEHGLSQEFGLDYLLSNDFISFVSKVNFFNNNVSDWIIWKPDLAGTWMPTNAKEVWSRGMDLSVNLKLSIDKCQMGIDLMGTSTLSTVQKSTLASEVNKQLPYVPKIKTGGSMFFAYNNYLVKYNHSYTSKRSTVDNNLNLESYNIGSLLLEMSFKRSIYAITTFFRIENVWNVEYQAMLWYPMPLRNYQLGVSIQFNKPIH